MEADVGIDEWPNDEEMAYVCEPSLGGCGHTQGQHEYGTDYAPCCEQGCPCRIFH